MNVIFHFYDRRKHPEIRNERIICWKKVCLAYSQSADKMMSFTFFNVRRSVNTPQDKKYEDHALENNVSLAQSQSITQLSKKK